MNRPRLTRDARRDLAEIWQHIAADNTSAADRWTRLLWRNCTMLAENPYLGRNRPELARNLRSHPVGNYMIYYRPVEQGVQIIRIISGFQDIARAFASGGNEPD